MKAADKRYTKQKILIIFGACVITALLIVFALSGGNLALIKSLFIKELSNEEMKEILSGFGWRGYIVIAALSLLQVVCTFLPAEPIQVLAGVTFSFPVALLCCMIGVMLGNTLIYMLQKTFGEQMRGFFIKKLNLNLEVIARSGRAVFIIFILYFFARNSLRYDLLLCGKLGYFLPPLYYGNCVGSFAFRLYRSRAGAYGN